ncbi:ABC transporter substrate-binding protein [Nocardioides sp. HDW12B]|uniref:ABC transporter substrate-binding protein n=1 Tax=Nocardioides sp. HDW12B TaxID=2714939 RepID=UPI001407F130|nr:ABC transporter substrate-binding protein [Nocardioides sp. HDW12B]QIK67822.1 ABC transporter substrate-binding protein [Nocardioides sp. HDW12B]
MKRTPLIASLTTVALLGLAGCGGGDEALESDSSGDSGSGDSGSSGEVVVGSANFPENALLAEIYAGALNGAGVEATTKLNIGSREVYIPAIEDASIDILPEYTGVLRDYFLAEEEAGAVGESSDSEGVYSELTDTLPEELTVLDYSEAEDKDAVVVTSETAEEYDLTEIGDLAEVAGDLTLGGAPEWKTRQTGLPGLEEVYGVVFGDFIELDAGGPQSLGALLNGRVDAANLFTTDPNIAAEDLVPLEDPDALFAAQNIVPLLRSEVVDDTVTETLNSVSEALDTETLGALVTQVVIDKEDPQAVAEQFLADNDLA